MASYERNVKLKRSRNGMIFGVCQGIADWKGINAGYIRLAFVVLTIVTGFFPFGLLYLLAAFFLPLEPSARKSETYSRSSVKRGYYDLKQEFEDLASRFGKENNRSSYSERDWDNRFKENGA